MTTLRMYMTAQEKEMSGANDMEPTNIEIAKDELRFVLGKLRDLQGVNKMSPWAALEALSEFIKDDLHSIFQAVDTCQTAVLNVEMELNDLQEELEEEMNLSAERGKELDKWEEAAENAKDTTCYYCNRPGRYCICP